MLKILDIVITWQRSTNGKIGKIQENNGMTWQKIGKQGK